MADEQDKPTSPDAPGAGTKAHKLSKAEQAKLPGGADFDVDNATDEDFEKHEKILRRRASVDSLATTPLQAVTSTQEAAVAEVQPAEPDPNDIRAVNKEGEVRYFNPTTWDLLGADHAGWKQSVAKPKDVN